MTIRKFAFYTLLFCFLMAACAVDYDMKSIDIDEPNRIVVNSFLTPEKPISVHFYTVNRTDEGFTYRTADNLHVKLTEDNHVLFDGLCADTILAIEHRPQAGARYRIEVSLTGYASVWAETTVPSPITCTTRAEPFGDDPYYTEMKYFLSGFAGVYEQENTSIYLLAYSLGDDDTILQCSNYYASNVLLDPINRTNGIEAKDQDVGSASYDYFMRVKNANIPYLNSLIFITYMPDTHIVYYDDDDGKHAEWVTVHVQNYLVKLITAGPEYDMYHRTCYQQANYIVYDEDFTAILYQPFQVYSNINGGLGIFAGMNEANYYFDAPEKPERPQWPPIWNGN